MFMSCTVAQKTVEVQLPYSCLQTMTYVIIKYTSETFLYVLLVSLTRLPYTPVPCSTSSNAQTLWGEPLRV